MKKIYFLLSLVFLSFQNFAATWYANTGNANDTLNWWSTAGYTGTHPSGFSTTGDIWMIGGNMSTSAPWTNAGSLVLTSGTFTPFFDVTVGGDLTMNGSSVFSSGTTSLADITVSIYGNLSVNGTASWDNPPYYTHIHFANSSSTLASPQTLSWTSTNSGQYTNIVIESGVTVKLLSNVLLPNDNNEPEILNGTLVCDNYTLNTADDTFRMNDGAKLYTMNAGGVDSTIHTPVYEIHTASNFVFNGSAPQVTGVNMPTDFASGGSFTVNNAAGVWLTSPTVMHDGSTVTLTSGHLVLGANYLGLAIAANLAGTFSSSTMFVTNGTGTLIKQFTQDTTFTFPIGDTTNYAPLTVNMTAGGYGGASYVTARTTNSKQPSNANLNDYLNRYWSVTTSGVTAPSYTLSGTYVTGDVTGIESNLSAGSFVALPWHKYGAAAVLTHTLTSGTITDLATDFTGISTAAPSLTLTASGAVCIGSSRTLNVVSTIRDTPFTYSWAPSTGLSVATGTSVVATPGATTTYTVTVTDGNGFTGTAMTTVTVNQYPAVDTVTGGGSYCAGGTGVHIRLNTSDTGVNYQLYHTGTAVGSPVAGIGSLLDLGLSTAAGSYTVTATGVHTGCAIGMAGSANVVIIPVVIPTINITSSMGDTLCTGTNTTFMASFTHGGSAPSFQWKKNGTVVGVDSMNYSNIPANGNTYIVKMRSNEVCAIPDTVSDTLVMTVRPYGTPAATIVSDMGTRVCNGTAINVTATPTFGGYHPSYSWVKNTLTVASGASYSFTPANGDHLICIMTSDYQCRLATTAYSNVIDMTVDAPIVPYVTIAAYPGLFIAPGSPDTLIATVYDGGTTPSYQWYRNNVAVPGATTNMYIRSSFTDKDSISCMVTRDDVCALSSINSVVIKVYRVGVNQINFNGTDISLTPNPNNGAFTVKGSVGAGNDVAVTMEVTNMLGQVVYQKNTTATNGELNEQIATGGSLANGIYILNVHTANGNGTFRFVIEK